MSDSSSSDSENDPRFREACDPTLLAPYIATQIREGKRFKRELTRTGVKKGKREHTHTKHTDNTCSESRESFLLMNKLKKTVAAFHSKKGGPRTGDSRSCTVSLRRKAISSDSPSSLSLYLAKQLSSILNKNVDFEAKPIHTTKAPETTGGQSSICILKNVTFEVITKEDAERAQIKRRKAARKAQKKYSYFDSSDEEEMSFRCSSLAVTPHWLLHNDHFPWPQPKNTRYLEKFVVKERHRNGNIVVVSEVSGKDAPSNIVKTEEGKTGHHKMMTSRKTKCETDSEIGVASSVTKLMNGKLGNISTSTNSVGTLANGNQEQGRHNGVTKVRKQARKRGKKRAKKINV